MARFIFLFLGFLILSNVTIISICNSNFANAVCIESEKEALLKFKQGVVDHTNRLASWVSDRDCCRWTGIVCDDMTSHVVELHLRTTPPGDAYYYVGDEASEDYERSRLGGKISPSLLHLKYLSYLDLSNNDFGKIHIPKFFGSLKSLIYLNLSTANFGGEVPHHLGNLSNLKYLNLRNNYYTMYVENLHWLPGLSSLEYLDLSYVNLSQASTWFHALKTLPSLVELHLSNCQLPHQLHPIASVNLSSLAVLSLSLNYFQNLLVINWVFGLKNLISLDLSRNFIGGPIPYGLRNLSLLKHLDLHENNFSSSIPNWLYAFAPLESLNLGSNYLQGEISSDIGKLNFVVDLDLSFNSFKGQIPIKSIGNLCNLRSLSFSGVTLSLDISNVLEVFSECVSNKLESLSLYRCQLYGQLTNQLLNFKNLRELDLSFNSISSLIPISIGELSSLKILFLYQNKFKGNLPKSFGQLIELQVVDISYNFFEGTISEIHFLNLTKLLVLYAKGNSLILKVNPDWIPPFQIQILWLGSWHLGPQFPHWLTSQTHLLELDISNSGISGTIPGRFLEFSYPLSQIFPNLTFLDLSNNLLSGSFFNFLCLGVNETMDQMKVLNLRSNCLSGELPNCWFNWPNLEVIVLDNNSFTGNLPSSIGILQSLQSLHLCKNNLSGEFPVSIRNCTALKILDFGENELVGNIPSWMGRNLPYLTILTLRSNKFSGHIPKEVCALNFLQVFDVAHNSLSGSLPSCVSNLSAMVYSINNSSTNAIQYHISSDISSFVENILLWMKGRFQPYDKILNLVRMLDLSDNNLSGDIPREICKLQRLQSLNLSHNHFTKMIPPNIGDMSSIETLDLSVNKLEGSIPESMSKLSFLNSLNLSDNQLTGKIPSSTQLQSFDASSYARNELCGPPLGNNCSEVNQGVTNTGNGGRKDMDGVVVNWFLVSMALGFILGFWSVLSPLVISRRWRHAYYQYLDEMWWKVNDSVSRFF